MAALHLTHKIPLNIYSLTTFTMNSQRYDSYISYSNSEVFQAILTSRSKSRGPIRPGRLHTEFPDMWDICVFI